MRERLAPDLWNARIDRGELERAIVNLAVNGRDAMGTNGTLTIETRNIHLDEEYAEHYGDVAAGDYAEISIIDTGSGMTPEVLKRVFEPFFTTKEFGKGSGLGLSMVYGFAKQSGGHASVYSEPGKYTVVHLYLPRAGGIPEDETGPTPESALRQQFAGLTTLIVEDEERLRKVAVKMLSALGLNILEEADGAAALASPPVGAAGRSAVRRHPSARRHGRHPARGGGAAAPSRFGDLVNHRLRRTRIG